ncbi:aldehyde dehydrogenase [Cellulophaga lytica]|uniref:Aldehyde dehydrogenase n=1 Tax=Cellulophaga lytica (strain ATCC 23178 / DSM 7489 / JCM 8516 / NBRC 14961 / NCIMB 1423 / VKM B-1433 / Cy l20) TaxID=867900 RepID=F0RA75_CELLC|nr:aldehyde dehydrogenase [Cellulophaga lytica]ADY29419.1 Aldehyde Dehydrogenase [Cellulophaga lytica DSM 7489]AIM60431.1 aldehyde dehydrogenase [Cellulophaga lytica]WQG76407.1 aldehyde dehydrogenase [Cellulophaga lytica]
MMEILQKQQTFFKSQQTKNITYRKQALIKLKQEITKREADICDAIYADFKKPRFESMAAETQFVLAELNYVIKHLKKWARPEKVSGALLNFPSSDWLYKEPYGTVLIVAPWNYPFQLAIAPLIGAIAAGNTAVIKPSEITPNTSKIIVEIITAVFSDAYVAVVEGGVEVSKNLLAQKWDYIFFTGSTKVGKIFYKNAAEHLTPITLELGGKNPAIVDTTANIKLAAKRIVWGKFLNAGQTCIATDYILVHKDVKDKLIIALQKSIEDSYGKNIEDSSDYARTVSKNHFNNLNDLLEGQEIIFGGQTNAKDNYMAPTLVNEPSLDSKLMQGEIFGPILPIIAYTTEEDIQKYVLNYGKPLATYVFSTNRKFQQKIITKYSFGGGAINDTVIHITNKKLPFGGVGSSGIGAYHGKTSFDTFTHQKAIIKRANWLEAPLRYPPYNLPLKLVEKVKHLF